MTEQIYFNQKEVDYINNSDFLLTKRKITEKIFGLLSNVQEAMIPALHLYKDVIPEEVLAISGKISRGENYESLPYLILDYPRYFKKEHVFAIRTMFWWGNYCSITLQLQGDYLEKYKCNIIPNLGTLRASGSYYICINETPWEYHFQDNNYVLLNSLSDKQIEDIIRSKEFLKISARVDFSQMLKLDNIALDFIDNMVQIIK